MLFSGDDVGYAGLHQWLRRTKPLTGRCVWCGATPPDRVEHLPGKRTRIASGTDLHNLSGEYKRDVTDYVEICRKCHHATKEKRVPRTRPETARMRRVM